MAGGKIKGAAAAGSSKSKATQADTSSAQDPCAAYEALVRQLLNSGSSALLKSPLLVQLQHKWGPLQ
jgi:hypothetical protein